MTMPENRSGRTGLAELAVGDTSAQVIQSIGDTDVAERHTNRIF